jgi:GAF domain-containing protein
MFGVLDRTEPGPISDEDVRRARALAAQVAIALELTRNLHQSEEHRRRAEALVAITLELNNVLHLPEFTRTSRFAQPVCWEADRSVSAFSRHRNRIPS